MKNWIKQLMNHFEKNTDNIFNASVEDLKQEEPEPMPFVPHPVIQKVISDLEKYPLEEWDHTAEQWGLTYNHKCLNYTIGMMLTRVSYDIWRVCYNGVEIDMPVEQIRYFSEYFTRILIDVSNKKKEACQLECLNAMLDDSKRIICKEND